jgi:hypothetical protein
MDAELSKPIEYCFFVFQKLGMWKDGNQTRKYFFRGYLFHFLIVYLHIIRIIIYIAIAGDSNELFEAIGFLIAGVGIAFRCINFIIKLNDIKKLVESLNELLKFSAGIKERKEIQKNVDLVFRIYIVFWFFGLSPCVNAIYSSIKHHQLAFKIWMPFIDTEMRFWFHSIIMIFHSFFIATIAVSLIILPVAFMSFAVGFINELNCRVIELGNVREDKNVAGTSKIIIVRPSIESNKQELIRCIEMHLKIKKLAADIQEIYIISILFQGLKSSAILCALVYSMSNVSLKTCERNNFLKLNSGKKFRGVHAGFCISHSDFFRDFFAMLFRK